MPVELFRPDPASLFPVPGLLMGVAEAGIRRPDHKDLLLMVLAEGARIAAVFTRNRFCAAPVQVAKSHLGQSNIRALVINTGCANAGTGDEGLTRARQTCDAVASLLDCDPMQVLPFSTGVIMEALPVDKIAAALPRCVERLTENNWLNAAEAIMTTDTVPKAVSRRIQIDGQDIAVSGVAKGSGMICPNMATMLAFIATDAPVAKPLLQSIVAYAADRSFNCVTVDGDASTNDSFVLVSTATASIPEIENSDSPQFRQLLDAVTAVSTELAQSLVRDGEGATKFITIVVENGVSETECRKVAYAIAHSPLVKTAFFASDPNLGRILAAIGNAGVDDLDVHRVDLFLDDVLVAECGGRAASYIEEDGKRVMSKAEITVRVRLHRGAASATIWTCDLSHDYVSINTDYRS